MFRCSCGMLFEETDPYGLYHALAEHEFTEMTWAIHHGDVVDVCHTLAGERFHAVLCDPPYDIGFMGKKWDTGAQFKAWGEAILPLLHPGALVLMFGGTRTWHRLAIGMEDAGFQMWDTLMWLYGQGFPKAQDISKLIDKQNGDERTEVVGRYQPPGMDKPWNLQNAQDERAVEVFTSPRNNLDITAAASEQSAPWSGHKTCSLKPAWEPILCFKAPTNQTYAANALATGAGCLNVDGGRIGFTSQADEQESKHKNRHADFGSGARDNEVFGADPRTRASQGNYDSPGRYPANLCLDEESARLLDQQSGKLHARGNDGDSLGGGGMYGHGPCTNDFGAGDAGGASRFFYCAKASSRERNAGCDAMPEREGGIKNASGRGFSERDPYKKIITRNTHPTVKPIDLCCWLATLLLPPDSVQPRRLLVPFSGSGSEIIAALRVGWEHVTAIEREGQHIEIAVNRVIGDAPLFNTASAGASE